MNNTLTVNAHKVLWATSKKASKYRVNGIEEWVPNSVCNFIQDDINDFHKGDIPGKLTIQVWFYDKTFK